MNGVIYARYSSERQNEQSIEGQLRECNEYAKQNNIRIVGTYIDRAKTGTNDHRPEFQKMLRDSKQGVFECVIVWKIDRFGRNREDIAKNKAILRRNGVQVLYAKEHIPDGAEGIILEGLLESLAEYYSAELREKITRGMRESAYKCQFNGSGLSIGYVTDKEHKFHIDPINAKVVQKIFDMYEGGKTKADILRWIQSKGIKTPKGKEYTHYQITRMLKNRQYIGEYRWHDIVIPGGMPQIISEEQFERVAKLLEKNVKSSPHSKSSDVPFLLTGKIFCGCCKGTMIGDSGTSKTGNKFYYYTCRNRKTKHTCKKKSVRKEWLEREIVRITSDLVLTDSTIEYIADKVVEIQKKESGDDSMLMYYKSRLAETEKSIKNIMKAIEAGIITETTGARLKELEGEREDIKIEIEKEKLKRPVIKKEHIIYFLEKFKSGDIEDFNYQRKIIDMFVNRVFVYDDKIIITYNYSGENNEVTAEIVETAAFSASSECSDMFSSTPPIFNESNTRLFFLKGGMFGVVSMLSKSLKK